MQEVFENIIEKLEEIRVKKTCNKEKCDTKELCRICVVDDAIEIVKQEAEKYTSTVNSEEYEKGFEDGAESVRSIAYYQDIGWIPCSERLPEENINPLTGDFYMYPVMYKNENVSDIKYYYFGKGHWYHGFKEMDGYVTHWMDINPYQPKGE